MYPGSGQALRLAVAFMAARGLTPSGSDLLFANEFEANEAKWSKTKPNEAKMKPDEAK